MPAPYLIGLTGGIGCGKSSVAEIFRALGAAIVDTDEIARALTLAHGVAIEAIRSEFGDAYIAPDGSLDRPRMRRLAFDDPHARRRLEAILHPLIRARSQALVENVVEPYALLVVPLLFETGAYAELVQRVLVVDCDEARQVERTMQRSGLSRAEVCAIMAAQLPRAERVARADDIINNDADMEALKVQAERLHEKYLRLAAAHRRA